MMKADVVADTISHNTVIKACAEAREVAEAQHWLSEMMNAGVQANPTRYNPVMAACAVARDLARAEHWRSEMTKASWGKHHQVQHCDQGMY